MFPLNTIRGKVIDGLTLLLKQRKVRRGIAAALFFILITLIISIKFVPHQVDLKVGQVSPNNIEAPRTVVYEDKARTDELRRQAAEAVRPSYNRDDKVIDAVQKDISDTIATIGRIQEDKQANQQAKENKLKSTLPFILSDSTLKVLAIPNPAALELVEQRVNRLIGDVMETEEAVTLEKIDDVRKSLSNQIRQWHFEKTYESLAQGLAGHFIRPNKILDAETTRLLKQAAMDTVQPQMVRIQENEIIIRAGEVVKPEHITRLQAVGLSRPGFPWRVIIGSALLVALLMVVVLYYLYQQNREIYDNAGHLYLLGIIVVVVLAVAKAIIAINVTQWPEFGALFGYMVPLAAAGMLIAILLDSRLAVLVVAVMSFLLSLMTDGQIRFGIVGLVGGITGVYSVSKLSQRGDLVRAGMYTSAANVAAIMVIGLLYETPTGLVIGSGLLLGLTNGILSSILTNGALPYLESTFGITSSVRLLELSHPSNPLLKRLLTEAPGTYHHSIIVGNLAEAATEAVGGESLLVRVAAYYHDIGKIKRPYFFIENQMTSDNPHDKIAPSLSTLILTSHVKDGIELAKEYKLPKAVTDIIEQHHGAGLCSFFYHKAVESGKGENISEDEFRYEGPKPQTREAAIVMLADSVEAAVRSLQNRTHGRVEGLVRKIIKDKLMDGQLDECDLTFRDLDLIATAFLKVLSGIFHSRVEYPDMSKEMERRKSKNGGPRKQSPGRGPGG